MKNCLFLGNVAVTYAGGVYNSSSNAKFTNCTFYGNSAAYGGAIRNSSSTPIIQNTIIYGNSSGIYNAGGNPMITYSLVQELHDTSGGNIDGDTNPVFVDSSDPDGPDDVPGTDDDGLRLEACSPGVDKGNNSYIVQVSEDLKGEPRIYNNEIVDLGAFETQAQAFDPELSLSQNPAPACAGSMVTITANFQEGTNPYFFWILNGDGVQSGSSTQYQSSSMTDGDTMILVASFDECTLNYIDTLIVEISPTPDAIASPANQETCSGSLITPIIINGSVSGTTWQWTRDMPQITGIAMSGSGNISGTLTNSGNTPVTVTFIITPIANGCSGVPDTATVIVNPLPIATATASPNPVCENELMWFTASGGVTYHWTGPGGFTYEGASFGRHMTLDKAGTYMVTVTSSQGCSSVASVSVSVNALPVLTISISPNPACTGDNVQLNATGGASYKWSGPNGFYSTQQNPVLNNVKLFQSGNYSVTVTGANGCTAVKISTLKVNATPIGRAWYDEKSTCEGSTLFLFATGGGTYQWTGPAGFSSTLQNPLRANLNSSHSGIYTVVITNLFGGCTASYSVNVQVHPLPSVNAWTTTPEVCEGDAAYLFASGGIKYDWTGPLGFHSTIQNPIIYNMPSYLTGIYTVTVSNEFGCVSRASTYIDVQSVTAIVNATPNPVPYGGTLYLTASGGESYQWSGPNGFYSTQQNPVIYKFTLVNSGLYVCIVSSKAGCQDSEIILVQVKNQNAQDEPQLETRSGKYVQVFPNPAKDVIRVDDHYTGTMSYTIIDAQGNAILQGKTTSGDQISIDQLNSGSYYIEWTYSIDGKLQSNISKFIKIK